MARVESLTHHAMGRLEDGTLVPRVLPGEEIEMVEGAARIVTPSPRRVAAPCRHFKTCGGCAMQHADDAFVADWKIAIVQRALEGQGVEGTVAGILTSPPESRRRAKFTGRRGKKGGTVGFKGRASDLLVEVPECKLVEPAIRALIPALEEIANIGASRKAECALTITTSQGGADIQVESERELTAEIRSDLAQIAEKYSIARVTWGRETAVLRTPPVQMMGAAPVIPPAGSFLQATREGEAALLEKVLEITQGAKRVVDLFSGCGTFSLPLASRAQVLALEGSAEMTEALEKGWRAAGGLHQVVAKARDLFRNPLYAQDFKGFDAAVIDPPRAGAEAQVRELAQSNVPVIAMVSCNPATFARDAKTLIAAGYEMGEVWVVDQFRWSTHVEVVTSFKRT